MVSRIGNSSRERVHRRLVLHRRERRPRPHARAPPRGGRGGSALPGWFSSGHGHWMPPSSSRRAYDIPPCMGERERTSFQTSSERRLSPIVPQPPRQVAQDRDVVAGLARGLERLAHALHAPLAARHGPLALAPRRRRGKHHVGHLGGPRQEDVLHHEVVELLEQVDRACLVGLGLARVLADDVERPQLVPLHRLEHLRSGASRGAGAAPRPRPARTAPGPRRSRCPGSRGTCSGWRPCRRRPGRCSARAAG